MTEKSVTPASAPAKERILLELHPMVLPAILTFENIALLGIIFVAGLAIVTFHVGGTEVLIIAAIWAVLAFPNFRSVFDTGSTSYVLTNRRLMIFAVTFRKQEVSIPLEEIASVKVKQSGLQRFYGSGDVLVTRKGFNRVVRLRALPNCKQIAKQITQTAKNMA